MNKKIIIGIVILMIGLAILFASSHRYSLLRCDDRVYKIDHWTGKTWLIEYSLEQEVRKKGYYPETIAKKSVPIKLSEVR